MVPTDTHSMSNASDACFRFIDKREGDFDTEPELPGSLKVSPDRTSRECRFNDKASIALKGRVEPLDELTSSSGCDRLRPFGCQLGSYLVGSEIEPITTSNVGVRERRFTGTIWTTDHKQTFLF